METTLASQKGNSGTPLLLTAEDMATRTCNTGNVRSCAPFSLHDEPEGVVLRAPRDFVETLPPCVTLDGIARVDHDTPPEPHKDDEDLSPACYAAFITLYTQYVGAFAHPAALDDPMRDLLPPYHALALTDAQKEALAAATRVTMLKGVASGVRFIAESDDLCALKTAVTTLLLTSPLLRGKALFIKTGQTSGKNDAPLAPCSDASAVVARLTCCDAFLREWTRPGVRHIIFMPWDHALDKEREFRVFVAEHRVVAVSQQLWFRKVECMLPWAHHQQVALGFLEAILGALPPERLRACLPYSHAVLDLWVDDAWGVHVIEANPGRGWASSGASLFDWSRDQALLEVGAEEAVIAMRI